VLIQNHWLAIISDIYTHCNYSGDYFTKTIYNKMPCYHKKDRTMPL